MFLTVETDFGLNMLKHAPANESLVVSPLSVIFALAMVQAGAKGTTKSQINAVLSKGSSDSEIEEHYSKLSSQIMNARKGVKSSIANGFFLNKQFAIEKDYEKSIKESYNAKVEALDFDKANEAAKVIDGFISKTTEGKIKDMVNEGMVKGAHSLIVNAIYFTAKWENPFRKNYNTEETFYSAAGKGRKIEFMHSGAVYRQYAEDGDFQVVSLRYLDTSFAFNIFLPKTRFGLYALRSKLDGEKIQRLLSSLKETYITVAIPKMKIETQFKLKEALIAMGVSEMFTDKADLSGITKVDEEGTTAAAGTVLEGAGGSFARPVTFFADHPFLFVLTKENNPLFMGSFI